MENVEQDKSQAKNVRVERLVSGTDNWKDWNIELPEKGRDIDIIDTSGQRHNGLYRCNCHNQDCKAVRGLFGELIITPSMWKYP